MAGVSVSAGALAIVFLMPASAPPTALKPKRKYTRSAKKARTKVGIAERRRLVALYLRSHPDMSQQDIARLLGVSEATVSGDVAALKAGWEREAMASIDQVVRQDLAALDADEAMFRLRMLNPSSDAEYHRCYEQVMVIQRRRAALLGLDVVVRRRDASNQPSVSMRCLIWCWRVKGSSSREGL